MKKRKLLIVFLILISIFSIYITFFIPYVIDGEEYTFLEYYFGRYVPPKITTDIKKLEDIAYYKRTDYIESYTLYIEENGQLEPYLVIEDDYNGNSVLLLRKYLTDEKMVYSDHKFAGSHSSNSGYYSKSYIDKYMNNEFLSRFNEDFQKNILNTSVEISSFEAVNTVDSKLTPEIIVRKIFTISITEANIYGLTSTVLGKPLKYFKDGNNFVTTTKSGQSGNYWLRSSYLWDNIQAFVIAYDGSYGGSLTMSTLSIRPAFCLPKDTLVKGVDIDGEMKYVLATY